MVQHPDGSEQRVVLIRRAPGAPAAPDTAPAAPVAYRASASLPTAPDTATVPDAVTAAPDAGVGGGRVRLVGLGLVFKEPDGRPGREVFEVKIGSAGEEGLLEKGDRVISIDGTPLVNLSNQELSAAVKALPDSPALLVVK